MMSTRSGRTPSQKTVGRLVRQKQSGRQVLLALHERAGTAQVRPQQIRGAERSAVQSRDGFRSERPFSIERSSNYRLLEQFLGSVHLRKLGRSFYSHEREQPTLLLPPRASLAYRHPNFPFFSFFHITEDIDQHIIN